MTDLRLDLGRLGELRESLTTIGAAFDGADAAGGTLSGAVDTIGDLQYRVGAFASNWDDTRGRISGNLRTIADAVESIRQTFEDLDALLTLEAEGLSVAGADGMLIANAATAPYSGDTP